MIKFKKTKQKTKKSVKKTEKRKVLVTSALPYVNNIPHLGNLICVISADVYTRFLRLKKVDVISVLGTDEHGTTSEVKALEEGITPKQVCDKYSKIHKNIYDFFLCNFDCYGRTSSKKNHEITKDIFLKLYKNGYILTESGKQAYCETDKRFLSDRFVEGECPHCKYEHARGDQCENCGKLLNPEELINAKCKICKNKPEFKETSHLFIDLPKLEPELREWIDKEKKTWTHNAVQMTEAWLREGLKPRAITRDLKWGIPVPLKGFENKVFYSWFDAPIGYISITAEKFPDTFKNEWWQNPEVELVQFMGKDNIPFHTILFPSFLIGTRDPWILVRKLSVNEYLNYESGQFSKSRNIGVFGDDAIITGIKPDVWRYYLLRNRPENNDSVFLWQEFMKKTNNELVANLGNLVNRTMFFINKFYESKIPPKQEKGKTLKYETEIKKIEELYEKIELRQALCEIMTLSRKGNQYFQENEPWKTIKENKEKADNAIYYLAKLVKDLSILITPFLPEIGKKIQEQLGLKNLDWHDLNKDITTNHRVNEAKILVKKIEQKEVDNFVKKFNEKNIEEVKEEEKKSKFTDFSILNLKVAKVIDIKEHPNAEKLYVLQIDLGKEKRQIVAGLRQHYKKEDLFGKNLIIVTNLEPAKIRGVESNGMLLAADNGNDIGILTLNAKPGTQITIDEQNNEQKPKENIISFGEFSQIEIIVKNGYVLFNNKYLLGNGKRVVVEKVKDGKVK
ncbi:MAG: methionine--tRNA ligase [Candidatus Woesearchaeota archaeon]